MTFLTAWPSVSGVLNRKRRAIACGLARPVAYPARSSL
jgi:hypothetical protein